jgi:transcriptional regulator with XRE-family HTH domain
MEICSIVGINVRKLRNSKKLSQEELAFRAGIDRSYLSEIENGHKNLSVVMLEQIAVALEVDICDLVKK